MFHNGKRNVSLLLTSERKKKKKKEKRKWSKLNKFGLQIGSFFMINLCLVVIATQFSETKKREMERMRLERARFHSTSTLASSTNTSEPTTCYAEIVKWVFKRLYWKSVLTFLLYLAASVSLALALPGIKEIKKKKKGNLKPRHESTKFKHNLI